MPLIEQRMTLIEFVNFYTVYRLKQSSRRRNQRFTCFQSNLSLKFMAKDINASY